MKHICAFLGFLFGLLATCGVAVYLELIFGIATVVEIPIALEGTFEYFDAKWQLIVQYPGIVVITIISILLSSFFYSLYRRLKRKKKDTYDKDSIKAPFVLYLRSFLDDRVAKKRISAVNDVRSEEEVLVSILTDIAPVYAIGDPRDKHMPLGASRVYVDDEHWKSTVIDMMNRAVLVVLRLGKTDSFWWEVETALKTVPIQKLMFIVPESKTFSNVSSLYKILLEHNIDIRNLNISVENKSRGSISSFIYFDNNGQTVTTEVEVPRFTRLFLSYENILRNALSGFREKYGLNAKRKRSVRWFRVMEFLLIISIILFSVGNAFNSYISLKYQMPYEFVERCVENSDFVNKYSNEINGTNLFYGIKEANKGMYGLEDERYKVLFLIQARAIISMSQDELNQITAAPKNLLLMVKKYVPDSYNLYIEILAEAAIIGIKYNNELDELISQYKSFQEHLPQWIEDLINSDVSLNDRYDTIVNHLDDEDIVMILKTIKASEES